jgi:hypothetical protein
MNIPSIHVTTPTSGQETAREAFDEPGESTA